MVTNIHCIILYSLVHVQFLFSHFQAEFSCEGNYVLMKVHIIVKHTAQIGARNCKQIWVYQLILTQMLGVDCIIAKLRKTLCSFRYSVNDKPLCIE